MTAAMMTSANEVPTTSEVDEMINDIVKDRVPAPSIDDLQAEISRLTEQLSIRDKLELQIKEESLSVDRAASEVLACESSVEEAKGELKAAKERYDKRVNALRDLVRDMATGQGRLDFDGAPGEMVEAVINGDTELKLPVVDPATTAPVSELGKKKLKEIVGTDVFNDAKDSEEPIGLTDAQVEALEGEDCVTIADLEKKWKKYPLFMQDLKGFGETAHNRLTASYAAWRKVYPHVTDSVSDTTDDAADDGVQRVIYRGDGVWRRCMSSPEWCQANPMEGREHIERGKIEWFTIEVFGEGIDL